MATSFAGIAPLGADRADRRFHLIMAIAMSVTILSGFVLNMARGVSSFAAPALFHVHGLVFLGWIGLYLAQALTIATGRRALHIRLGQVGYVWAPLMVLMGFAILLTVVRTTGGPFFFSVPEFLLGNGAALLAFGSLAIWSLRRRRHTGWHRRLMFSAMAVLTGPGLGRLLPGPLLVPNAWLLTFLATLIFPAIAMIADKRRHGHVHPAYWWGISINAGAFFGSLALANTTLGVVIAKTVVAGTPGAARPLAAFLPPGFAM